MPGSEAACSFRPLEDRDYRSLVELDRSIFAGSPLPPYDRSGFARMIQDRGAVGSVATVSGHVAGYLIRVSTPDYDQVIRFAVDPQFRRGQIATKLFGIQPSIPLRVFVPENFLSACFLLRSLRFQSVANRPRSNEQVWWYQFSRDITP